MKNIMEKKKKVCANCRWYWGSDTGCTYAGLRFIKRPQTTTCRYYTTRDKNENP